MIAGWLAPADGVFPRPGPFPLRLCPSEGLTRSQFDAGLNVATLMSRYALGTDWRQQRHWRCNDNVHPSRAGTYDGISFHPYETVGCRFWGYIIWDVSGTRGRASPQY
jgi:hypothetical protein